MRSPLLALALAACGGGAASSPKALADSGHQYLGAKRYAEALADFDAARALMQEGDPQWERVRMGRLIALAHTDADKAASEMVAAANAGSVELNSFYRVTDAMLDAGEVEPSRDVLKAAWSQYPEEKALQRLVLKALGVVSQQGDAAGALQGLGYTSGGDVEEDLKDPEFQASLREFLEIAG